MSESENGLSLSRLRAVNVLAGAESDGADVAGCDSEAVAEWLRDDPEFIAAIEPGQVIPEGAAPGRRPVSGLRRDGDSPGAGLRPRRPSVRPAPGLPGDPPSGRRLEGRRNRPDVGGGSRGQDWIISGSSNLSVNLSDNDWSRFLDLRNPELQASDVSGLVNDQENDGGAVTRNIPSITTAATPMIKAKMGRRPSLATLSTERPKRTNAVKNTTPAA